MQGGETMETRLEWLQPGQPLLPVSRVFQRGWQGAYRGIVPDAYLDALPEDGWVDALAQPGRRTLLLRRGEQIAGACSFGPGRDPGREEWGEIYSIYLLPGQTGRGLGGRLLRAALSEMAGRPIFLWVMEENARACRFYRRFGFAPGLGREERLCGRVIAERRYDRPGE